jgi:hypothetical protein
VTHENTKAKGNDGADGSPKLHCLVSRPPKIWREKCGVISNGVTWCALKDGYLYCADTLIGVLKQYFTEYRQDKHIVG